MRSDAELSAPAPGRLAWLRSQGLGLVLGQAAVLLLGIGSVVLAVTREGASKEVHLDDLTAFFRPPSFAHLWFYALAAVLALYALNTLLCTWDSVSSKWRRGTREIPAYAPAAIHLAFVAALVAHLLGGIFSADREPVVIADQWTPIGGGRDARLVSLKLEPLPNGRLKSVDAQLEIRDGAGRVERAPLGYNTPVSTQLGADLVLLEDAGSAPGALRFQVGDEECTAPDQGSCTAGGIEIKVTSVHEPGHYSSGLVAIVQVTEMGGQPQQVMLVTGRPHTLPSGTRITLAGGGTAPAVLVRGRWAPGNPWALASAVLLALGLAMMGRRWIWPA